MRRDFDTAAKTWGQNDACTRMSTAIADAMIGVLGLSGREVLLKPLGGRVGLADLDTESGDFHANSTGVEHFGFNRAELTRIFSGAEFQDIRIETAYEFVRPTPDGEKSFPILLLSARRSTAGHRANLQP